MYIDAPFSKKQIACHCGCGKIIVNKELIAKLWAVQEELNKQLNITSWTRCKKHNEEVGGTMLSAHLKGLAIDIFVNNDVFRYELITALHGVGFNRLGVGPNFVHADIDRTKRQDVIWLYSDRR